MKRGTRYAGRWSRLTLSRQTIPNSKQAVVEEAQEVEEDEKEVNASDVSGSSILTLSHLMKENLLEKDPFFALGRFQSQVLATVLEDIYIAVNILEEGNTNLRIMKLVDDLPLYIAKKYCIAKETKREPIHMKHFDTFTLKLDKLQRDRQSLSNAVLETYKGLIFERGFRYLYNYINGIDDYKGRAYLLELDEVNNKVEARGLRKRVRQQTNYYKTAVYDVDLVFEKLRMQIQDAQHTEELRDRFIDKWQDSRAEQLQMQNKMEQDTNIESTEYYKKRTEQEQIVNREIEMHISLVLNETLIKVDEIMKKYDSDLETIDLRIQILRNDYAQMLEKRMEMENRYNKHTQEIKDWIAFKDNREKRKQYQRDMHNAAIMVQAWWRGALVRKPWIPKQTILAKKKRSTKK